MDWTKIDNSPAAIRAFLEQEDLAPKKRWGQNFMVSPGARMSVVDAAGIRPEDTVWEVGPGLGAITNLLVERASEVTVFEIDHGVMRILQRRFGDGITIVDGDAVKTVVTAAASGGRDGGGPQAPDVVVGNLPYRSAAAIVAALLGTPEVTGRCRRMVFTVQREMALRMTASPGRKDYSPLSVLCALTAKMSHLSDLAGGSFYPVPEVVSSLVAADPLSRPSKLVESATLCARSLFTSRRKTLRNNASTLASAVGLSREDVEEGLGALGIDLMRRAETLRPEDFLHLAEWIASRSDVAE